MGYLFASWSCFLLYVCVVSQRASTHGLKDMLDDHLQKPYKQVNVHGEHPSTSSCEPSHTVFLPIDDLNLGRRIPICFSTKDHSTSPRLLSREETNSIPFSLSELPNLLDFFSFPKQSPQAKAMENTLSHCESDPIKGETKFCADSIESMLDSTQAYFGVETEFQVLKTTKYLSEHTTILQNYTVLEAAREVETLKMLACHGMPYPYAVFYCHGVPEGQEGDRKLFEMLLGGDNGERVEVVAACHMDTSGWDPDHVAFRVLGTRPGEAPVCHLFPADNIVWVAVAPPGIVKLVD